jgi:hypothetical protein
VEAKDVGVDLDVAQDTEQLKRYRSGLGNLILTDYLRFRLFRNGDLVHEATAATWNKSGKVQRGREGLTDLENLLQAFLTSDAPIISNAQELAIRMATLARLLQDLIRLVFAHEGKRGDLHGQYEAFKKVLLAELTIDEFADMYAQTIAYGLFAARCNHTGSGFTREHAGKELPKTNPFLRKLFNTIAGVDLDERIAWAVDDLARLLSRADMGSILADFGRATRREDPIVHFYETFLAAYDPRLREARGVYYTPEPVVGYIVRSVHALLKSSFKLKDGLADSSQINVTLSTRGKHQPKTIRTHKVQVLDPACGTGTFLYAAIKAIHESFASSKGMWPAYVAAHLLPRIYGFELLMAPYAVSHMKLGLELRDTGYDFATDERLRVFLTNSLEEAHELANLPLFAQWLADEAAAASDIKRDAPIMVVLGNPPYSGVSANRNPWIEQLVEIYKREPDGSALREHKHWLNDDYVKFLRFAQWRIEQTGYGIVAMVTNHGYLDNPTFRGMRHSLMQTFDAIHVIDLHGNSKKREKAPDGSKDDNVFDIQQGVAICLFVRTKQRGSATEIKYAELWGSRANKYAWLDAHDVTSTEWQSIVPEQPFLFFYPRNADFQGEYESYPSLKEIFEIYGLGFQSSRDDLVVSFNQAELQQKLQRFLDPSRSDTEVRDEFFPGKKVADYLPGDTRQWSLEKARRALNEDPNWAQAIRPTLYRPFDVRQVLYDARMVDWPRPEVLGHMLRPNLALLVNRQSKEEFAALCSDVITERKIAAVYDASTSMPLYVYDVLGGGAKRANFSPRFIDLLSGQLGLPLLPEGQGDLETEIGPEDVFHYFYAVLYSPTYRKRYEVFVRTDFPRVPITSNRELFATLAGLGKELVDLHLMRATAPNPPGYPIPGPNTVEKPKFRNNRIYINGQQYFDGVSESVWNYHVGGYQVADKWLKDKKGRSLTYDELTHYRHVIAALAKTIHLQAQIDAAIGSWPLP